MVRMPEFCAPALGNKPNVVTIDAFIPPTPMGYLQARREFGRLDLLRRGRHAGYEYNLFIIQRTKIRAKEKLPTGK